MSELLRGTGLYPRWEITSSLLHLLGIPTWPMRRLWTAAAVEAHKKPDWINGCIQRVVLSTGPALPPLDHRGFSELNRPGYTSYARVFLRCRESVDRVVAETFDVLWLRWDEALASADVQKFAWTVLRAGVMARTPHIDGCPELAPAAFSTVALNRAGALTARFDQIEESLTLFKVLSRLPALQLDVMVLRYLRGMDDIAVADVLGVPIASVRSADMHARRHLTNVLHPQYGPREGHSCDSD
ncbi:sigma-70 family RNA polymerase sigma factor [Streptomyces sp. NPDC020681]|uniref:sigma-70 family RNA polymerase sigma factor n=1 Tax=Streptomyces sp. NPDC020681 TaxID=3365083 RepID=UPI0037BAE9D5